MKKEAYPAQRNAAFVFVFLILLLGLALAFSTAPKRPVSAQKAMQEADTDTPTPSLTSSPTFTNTNTPTLISGVLTCNTVVAGVTCINYGTYLDYNINIVVTGLTGGATASGITIGTYKRSTSGGYMGMSSDFMHCETSNYPNNKVYSSVRLKPFDAGAVNYPGFTSGAGMNACVANLVPTDWRYIPGTKGYANTISVRGNVDWPITGYSIVGHIYLYSNQNFMTVTPTMTPSPTATATMTKTPTPTFTATFTPTNTPAPHSGLTNAYRWAAESTSGAYSAIITGDPIIRGSVGQWSYMRVAVQKITNGNVYYAEIGWLKGTQPESNLVPRSYWTYRDINGFVDQGFEGYPGIGLAYNYKVQRTSSNTWSLYFNELSTPDVTVWLGWDDADRFFSGGEVPNGNQGMGDSDNNNVQYQDPTSANWLNACNTNVFNEEPSIYYIDAGGNCNSWRVYGNN